MGTSIQLKFYLTGCGARGAMKYSLFFGLAAIFSFYSSFASVSWIVAVLFSNLGIALLGLAMAYGMGKPGIFMKRPSGFFPLFTYLLFWPYLLLNSASLLVYRVASRENPLDEIHAGLYLGGKLWGCFDRKRVAELGIKNTLDLTAEFSEAPFIRKSQNYLNIPLLDTRPPTPGQLERAVSWIDKHIKEAPVFVHCALGHGRSGAIVAAYLIRIGQADNAQGALEIIRKKRPKAGFHPDQIKVINQYAKRTDEKSL